MRLGAVLLAVSSLALLAAPACASAAGGLLPPGALTAAPASVPTGRIVVHAHAGARLDPLLDRLGLVRRGPQVGQLGLTTVAPRRSTVPVAPLLAALRASLLVESAEAEQRNVARATANDPGLSEFESDPAAPRGTVLQWALLRSNFPKAWSRASGKGALVAVIDSGVDAAHPDLQGKIKDAVDYSGANAPRADPDGHGTHVASLACARTNNRLGLAGAGRDCRLLAIRTDLSDAAVAQGIVLAADRGAHAVTLSFGDDGSSPSETVAAAVRYAAARNVVLVAAAADEPTQEQGEPANLLQPTGTGGQGVDKQLGMSVTAATIDGKRASFAGFGNQVSVAAYGLLAVDSFGTRGLFAAYPDKRTPRESPPSIPCSCRASLGSDRRYAFLAGTSMAVPQVAALAAMIRAKYPALTAAQVIDVIQRTASRGGGWSPQLGWGIIDAAKAVAAAARIR